MLREDLGDAGRTHLVAGSAHSLQAAGNGGGGLDQDDEVDGGHVDTQLEGRGGNNAAQLTALEAVLDLDSLLTGHRAVVGLGPIPRRPAVDFGGESLRQAAAVDEEQGRAIVEHQAQQLGVDGRPDRTARSVVGVRGRLAGDDGLLRTGHVLNRNDDLDVEVLLPRGIDDGHRTRRPAVVGRLTATEELGDCLERVLGGRETDALRGDRGEVGEPLQAQRQVGAALGPGDGVDLIDDDPAHRAQDLPGLRGEHQVERFRRGDQDVGRVAEHRLAFGLRGVAGTHRRGQVRRSEAGPLRCDLDAGQGRPEVAVDVVGEGLHGRYVQHPAAFAFRGSGLGRADGRSPTGTPPGSCLSPLGHGSACANPRRSLPTLVPGRRSAPRTKM